MDDARVVEEAVAMARLAAPLEERHVVVAQGSRTLRVGALAAERRAGSLRGHPLRARAAVGRDQAKGDAVLVRVRVRARIRIRVRARVRVRVPNPNPNPSPNLVPKLAPVVCEDLELDEDALGLGEPREVSK
jgi:hypothetical protein